MVVGIPYSFANSSVLMRRHNQIMISEEIRALKGTQPSELITERAEAHIIAGKRFDEELQDERKVDQFDRQIRYDLYVLMQRNDVDRASHELLLETVIMVWGSFEVFVADFVRSHLNAYPAIATRLITDPNTKASFDMKSIGIDDLTANQFNVANAMGNILVSKRRLRRHRGDLKCFEGNVSAPSGDECEHQENRTYTNCPSVAISLSIDAVPLMLDTSIKPGDNYQVGRYAPVDERVHLSGHPSSARCRHFHPRRSSDIARGYGRGSVNQLRVPSLRSQVQLVTSVTRWPAALPCADRFSASCGPESGAPSPALACQPSS